MAAVYGVARPQPQPDLATAEGLIVAIEKQTALPTTVSTGGPRIADVNNEYRRRRQALIPALRRRGLTYPFPWDVLSVGGKAQRPSARIPARRGRRLGSRRDAQELQLVRGDADDDREVRDRRA